MLDEKDPRTKCKLLFLNIVLTEWLSASAIPCGPRVHENPYIGDHGMQHERNAEPMLVGILLTAVAPDTYHQGVVETVLRGVGAIRV